MNWIEESQIIFAEKRPENFGNFEHCDECAEHNELLKSKDLESLSLEDVSPASDPFCFCSDAGTKYYMPALIRLCLEPSEDFFFCQLLSHLEKDGKENSLFLSCTKEQRELLKNFIDFMINNYAEEIEKNLCDHAAFRTYDVWA